MNSNTTSLFSLVELNDAIIEKTMKEVYEALEERHYNPVNQLVGYLMSGDPGYISSHREARSKISELERAKILEVIVRNYLKNIK